MFFDRFQWFPWFLMALRMVFNLLFLMGFGFMAKKKSLTGMMPFSDPKPNHHKSLASLSFRRP